MAHALRVAIVFLLATVAGELIALAVGARGTAPLETVAGESARIGVKILVYVPPLLAALWAAATAKRVQSAFVAGLIWACVAHIVHAVAFALAGDAVAAATSAEPLFYWTRALFYRSALCVGVVVMFWGTMRRFGRMRGARADEQRAEHGNGLEGTAQPADNTHAWAIFNRSQRPGADAPADSGES